MGREGEKEGDRMVWMARYVRGMSSVDKSPFESR